MNILDPVETSLRVFPNDLDIFFHVNNGVYLTYADLGRTDLMLRSDTFQKIRRKGWYPVVAAETIKFKRSLTIGQRFTIETRILGWDERAIYIQQLFRHGEIMIADALIDARFLVKTGGKVSTRELMDFLGVEVDSPELPKYVIQWIASYR